MRTRLSIDVGEYERYVVAKYFAMVALPLDRDKHRTRATRTQMKRFVLAAFRSALQEQAASLRNVRHGVARRLSESSNGTLEVLREPSEKQRSLAW